MSASATLDRLTSRVSPVGPVGPGAAVVRPFLKWAGGKRQLLPTLRTFYPPAFDTYFEPFVGSGAVFFDLSSQGLIGARRVILSDVNRDVIGCYQAIQEDVTAVIEVLRRLESGHSRDGSAHYYAVRDHRFNPLRERLLESRSGSGRRGAYPAELAAMLIYLNRTGFNGLFRLNRTGRFNVPAGRYTRPGICNAGNLEAVARALQGPGTQIRLEPFEKAVAKANAGDFLYFDPPYAPASATARFTAYTAMGFTLDDQVRLRSTVVALAERGCHVLLSNSATPAIDELYGQDRAVRRAGLRVYRVSARRAINSNAAGRGPVAEVVVTNLEPPSPGMEKPSVHSV